MYDFDFLINMEFLREFKAFTIPSPYTVRILEGGSSMLPETAGPSEKEKMGAIMLSAMLVEKGYNKGEGRGHLLGCLSCLEE